MPKHSLIELRHAVNELRELQPKYAKLDEFADVYRKLDRVEADLEEREAEAWRLHQAQELIDSME